MIRPHITITDDGRKDLEEFTKIMTRHKDSYVSIGVHEGEYEDGTPIASVALWNEFGTERMPARSFIRSTWNETAEYFDQLRAELLEKIIARKETIEHALETIGERMKIKIQNKIKSNVPPPNAPSTIEHKQHEGILPKKIKARPDGTIRTSTLRDTDTLLESIDWKLEL